MSVDSEPPGPPSVFVEEMYWAVVEESWLFAVPLGGVDSDGAGGRILKGPWDPADCSKQLLAWFDAGLITLYGDPPDDVPRPRNAEEWRRWNAGEFDRTFEPVVVRELLDKPERWTHKTDDGYLRLVRTDAGMDPAAPWW